MSRRWDELSDTQKAVLLSLASVQVALAVAAWTDLAVRPADRVNGSKATWAAVIAVSFVGPVLYYTRGRRSPALA